MAAQCAQVAAHGGDGRQTRQCRESFRYRTRKAIVEPAIAWIKQTMGFRQFSFRGCDKARSEFMLVCAALNVRRAQACNQPDSRVPGTAQLMT